MSFLDKILSGFGSSDDPLEEAIQEGKQRERNSEYHSPEDDDWPFAYNEVETETLAGDEVYSHSEDGDVYAGQFVRSMIENRKYEPEDYTWFGYTKHPVRGVEPVGVPHNALFKHMALFGITGYGKSTVMKNMMLQWVHAGYGMCFIDPKGDDSRSILQMIPDHRLEDVVWVEPGNHEREKSIGFNFFDTNSDPGDPGHEAEVDEIRSDFVAILQEELPGWGATMDSISRAVSKQLIRAEEDYNVVDMYKVLNDEEEREAFANMFGNDIEQMYLQRVANTDPEDIEPLTRRLREWAENETNRQILGHEGSKLSLSEVVEDGKILLVNTANIADEQTKKLVTTSIVRRIWAKIRSRSDIPKSERDPFFLCIDEFDTVAGHENDIEDILSKGRSLRVSVFVANQQPNQLPDHVRDAVYSNCNSLFTFNPGPANYKDAKTLSKTLGDVDVHRLLSLGQFRLLGRLTINAEKTDAMLIHTFPEYPPLRSEEEVENLINKSIERYGVKPKTTTDMDEYGVLRHMNTGGEDTVAINEHGDTITPKQVLECVFSASLKTETKEIGDHDDWVHEDDLREEISKYAGEIGYESILDNVIEKIPEGELERVLDGDVYFRLPPAGEKKAFDIDTGQSASAGKNAHRLLLREGHKTFTTLGYDVSLPTQEGDSLPDGLAEPPIKPVEESETIEEAEDLRTQLEEEYPRIWELFGDNTVALEAESTTIQKPKQTIKNLAKAVEQGHKVAFLVKDGEANHDDFAYWARAGENIFTDPPFVATSDESGNRIFYNTSEKIELKDGSYALMDDKGGNTVWHETGKELEDGGAAPGQEDIEIVLENGDGDVIASFDDGSDLFRPSRSEFPYHYYRDNERQLTIVQDSDGNLVGEYENKQELKEDGFKPVYNPLIPENEFPDGEYPESDSWLFIVIPSEHKDKGPHIYRDGELKPLFPDGSGPEIVAEPITTEESADEDTSTDEPDTTDGETDTETDTDTATDDGEDIDQVIAEEAHESQATITDKRGGSENAKNADEVPVADPDDEPKSNTEVVKESGDVWTKPDEEDDDYNPAKDNTYYSTGYDADEASGDWTGGRARELDKNGDFEDYVPPSERDTDDTDENDDTADTTTSQQSTIEEAAETDSERDEQTASDADSAAEGATDSEETTPAERDNHSDAEDEADKEDSESKDSSTDGEEEATDDDTKETDETDETEDDGDGEDEDDGLSFDSLR